MTPRNVRNLIRFAEAAEFEVRQDYSAGGGQDPCIAIDVERGTSPFRVAAKIACYAMDDLDRDDLESFLLALAEAPVRQDSMGMGSIIYFPGMLAP